jgi:hypothetical protein
MANFGQDNANQVVGILLLIVGFVVAVATQFKDETPGEIFETDNAPSVREREQVVKALFNKGMTLGQQGDASAAIRT